MMPEGSRALGDEDALLMKDMKPGYGAGNLVVNRLCTLER